MLSDALSGHVFPTSSHTVPLKKRLSRQFGDIAGRSDDYAAPTMAGTQLPGRVLPTARVTLICVRNWLTGNPPEPVRGMATPEHGRFAP
jgi:hypothetical protein